MPYFKILDSINSELINKYNKIIGYKEYYDFICCKLHKQKISNSLWTYFNNIQRHHNEFYVHFIDFQKVNKNINLSNILNLINQFNLREGYDYISLTKDSILIGSHRNILPCEILDNINMYNTLFNQNTRIINNKHIKNLIDTNNNLEIHYIFTPNGFLKILFNIDNSNYFIDLFLNTNIIYDGYIRYIKLQNNKCLKKINSQESILNQNKIDS